MVSNSVTSLKSAFWESTCSPAVTSLTCKPVESNFKPSFPFSSTTTNFPLSSTVIMLSNSEISIFSVRWCVIPDLIAVISTEWIPSLSTIAMIFWFSSTILNLPSPLSINGLLVKS